MIANAITLIGIILLAVGAWQIYPPLAWLMAGAAALVVGLGWRMIQRDHTDDRRRNPPGVRRRDG